MKIFICYTTNLAISNLRGNNKFAIDLNQLSKVLYSELQYFYEFQQFFVPSLTLALSPLGSPSVYTSERTRGSQLVASLAHSPGLCWLPTRRLRHARTQLSGPGLSGLNARSMLRSLRTRWLQSDQTSVECWALQNPPGCGTVKTPNSPAENNHWI